MSVFCLGQTEKMSFFFATYPPQHLALTKKRTKSKKGAVTSVSVRLSNNRVCPDALYFTRGHPFLSFAAAPAPAASPSPSPPSAPSPPASLLLLAPPRPAPTAATRPRRWQLRSESSAAPPGAPQCPRRSRDRLPALGRRCPWSTRRESRRRGTGVPLLLLLLLLLPLALALLLLPPLPPRGACSLAA